MSTHFPLRGVYGDASIGGLGESATGVRVEGGAFQWV
jgi:hypothetical protein